MPLFWHGAPRHGAHLDSRLRSVGPEQERGESVDKYKENNERMLAQAAFTHSCVVKAMCEKIKMPNKAHLSKSTIEKENRRNPQRNL